MSITDIFLITLLAALAAAAVAVMIIRKRKGKGCGGCCENCPHKCNNPRSE